MKKNRSKTESRFCFFLTNKTRINKGVKSFRLLFMAVLLLGILVLVAIVGAAEEEPLEPLNGDWRKGALVPKHRAIISFMDDSGAIRTFRGQGPDTTNPLPRLNENVTSAGDIGRVFTMVSASGYVLSTKTISPGLYGNNVFKDVPTGVLCNMYLTGDEINSAVWLELTGKNGRLVRMKMSNIPRPAYKYMFKDSGGWGKTTWKEARPLDENVASGILGSDWNNDGFTDWVAAYVHNPNSWYTKDVRTQIILAYVDGKSLLECGGDPNKCSFYNVLEEPFSELEKPGRFPPNSMRLAAGDFNGDSVRELALYYTKVNSKHNDVFAVYSVNRVANRFERLFRDTGEKGENALGVGQWHAQNDSVGLAAGDINGDRRDEIALLYGRAPGDFKATKIYLSILKCTDAEGRQWNKTLADKEVTSTYSVANVSQTNAPIESAFGDLDSDGRPELVWYVCKTEGTTWFFIHRWISMDKDGRPDLTTGPETYAYDLAFQNHWKMYARNTYSMALGRFSYPSTADTKGLPMQIGLVQNGSSGNDMQWGVFGFNPAAKWPFITLGEGRLQGLRNNNVIPVMVAADLDEESIILGKPSSITMEDAVETFFVIQAPPRHWDEINPGKGIVLPVDAFFGLKGYCTGIGMSSSTSQISSTTDISEGKFGAGLETSYTYTIPKIFQGSVKIGAQYAREWARKHQEKNSITITQNLTSTADYDDQIYSRVNKYTVWRYPILFPVNESVVKVPDEKNPDQKVDARAFLQIVVPEEVGGMLLPASGRTLGWYRPAHDNFNLFTYPVRVNQIAGYPGSEQRVLVPGEDIKGVEFISQKGILIGNPGAASATLQISQGSHTEDAKSLKQRLGADTNISIAYGDVKGEGGAAFVAKVNLNSDYTWANDSSTTTDASKTTGITINWMGAVGYNTKAGFKPEDQTFYSDVAIYAQSDGTLSASYSVSHLKNQNTSNLWGEKSPYCQIPDPGLVLPCKWNSDGSRNDNTNSRYIRGVSFAKDSGAGDYKNVVRGTLLETGANYAATLRVFNMSFFDSGPLNVTLYWQTVKQIGDDYDKPDLNSAKILASKDIDRIYGRDNTNPNVYNWSDLQFPFTAPDKPEAAWLHVKINYKGNELNTDNNYGYILVGVDEPVKFSSTPSLYTGPGAGLPDLGIRELQVTGCSDNGATRNLSMNSLPRDKRLKIKGKLFLSSGIRSDGNTITHLPMVRVALLGGTNPENVRSILGGDEVPLMLSKGAYEFSFEYDPRLHRDAKVLKVKVFSPGLSIANDRDASNNEVTIWDDTGKP